MLEAERIIEYRSSRLPQVVEIKRIRHPPRASRETWSFDSRWRKGIGILELPVICPRVPGGLTGLADDAGAN